MGSGLQFIEETTNFAAHPRRVSALDIIDSQTQQSSDSWC
jgi:hypothetical protein